MVKPTMYRCKLVLTVVLGVAMGSLLYKVTSLTASWDEEDADEPLDDREQFEREKHKYFKSLDINLNSIDNPKQTEQEKSGKLIMQKFCGEKFAKPDIPVKDQTFQVMEDFHIYMYSAYLDLRYKKIPAIRILGLSIARLGNLYCQIYHTDGTVYSSLVLPHNLHWQGNILIFQTHMYICDTVEGRVPYAVSLTRSLCEKQISHLMQIQIRNKTDPPRSIAPSKPTFMVCLHKYLDLRSPYRIIEFMEYQKLLGVSAVVGYKYAKANSAVLTALEFYEKQGFLKLLPWGIDKDKFQKPFDLIQQQTFGPSIQIMDCLYRYMNNYTYIIPADITQFIVPVSSNITNYQSLLTEIRNQKARSARIKRLKKKLPVTKPEMPGPMVSDLNSVSIRVSKFCVSQMQHISEKPESVLFQIYRRDDLGQKATSEEKKKMKKYYQSIVNPRRTLIVHDTTATEPVTGYRKPIPAAPSVVLSHSYDLFRSKECKETDRTADKYKQTLTSAVNKVCKQLNLEPWSL